MFFFHSSPIHLLAALSNSNPVFTFTSLPCFCSTETTYCNAALISSLLGWSNPLKWLPMIPACWYLHHWIILHLHVAQVNSLWMNRITHTKQNIAHGWEITSVIGYKEDLVSILLVSFLALPPTCFDGCWLPCCELPNEAQPASCGSEVRKLSAMQEMLLDPEVENSWEVGTQNHPVFFPENPMDRGDWRDSPWGRSYQHDLATKNKSNGQAHRGGGIKEVSKAVASRNWDSQSTCLRRAGVLPITPCIFLSYRNCEVALTHLKMLHFEIIRHAVIESLVPNPVNSIVSFSAAKLNFLK